jgi:iron-sulfur cluster repair protein YtfE (RIC family)
MKSSLGLPSTLRGESHGQGRFRHNLTAKSGSPRGRGTVRKVQKEEAGSAGQQKLVQQICQGLKVHAQIEEEIAYPAFRKAGVTSSIMDEAAVEHATFEQLVEQLQEMEAGDDLFDATVKVLAEYVKHHVREEEQEMFPEVDESDADVEKIGEQLVERKRELIKANRE